MSDPAQIVTSTLGGKTFRSCRFCAAHLEDTIGRLTRRFANTNLVVIQPPFNDGVDASAGTHDFCSAFDVQIVGWSWLAMQSYLRQRGWAAWYRPELWRDGKRIWGDHIHMVGLGCHGPVGALIPGQIDDYYAHKTGLDGHAPDPSWHPADIDSTIFDFTAWEDAMALTADETKNLIDTAIADAIPSIVAAFLAARVDQDPELNVKAALRKAAK